MGVEVVGAVDMAEKPIEEVEEVEENGNESGNENLDQDSKDPIKFGSFGEVRENGEENTTSDISVPKDAVEEWPAFKQTHTFSFIRHSRYDDPKIKEKIDQADKEIRKLTQARETVFQELKAKNSEKSELINQMKSLNADLEQYNSILGDKKKEMEPLRNALSKLRSTNSAGSRGVLCSSEAELNDVIRSLQYRIQHESIPLSEEKQLIKEIKQLEGTRGKVIANAAVRADIQESMGQKEVLQDQVKLMGLDMDGVRKEHQAIWTQLTQLKDKRKVFDAKIDALREEMRLVTEKKNNAYDSLRELRKQNDEGNALFFQSRNVLNKAKHLAAMGDVAALKELSEEEVEKFMSLWCSSKTFRDDYEKRILPSLDRRQFSKDGRIRSPGERPLLAPEAPILSEKEVVAKSSLKEPKEVKSSTKDTDLKVQKAVNEKAVSEKVIDSKPLTDRREETEYEIPVYTGPKKDTSAEKEVDLEKLKEMKREEEKEKAKQALERKKKLAEKAAAKAAARAQKEAEKKAQKLQDREKKAKKAAASAFGDNEEEQTEPQLDPSESEKTDGDGEVVKPSVPAAAKGKFPKDKLVRHRNRGKAPESLPRAILKKKKSSKDWWLWAAPAAVLVLVLLVILYYYLF